MDYARIKKEFFDNMRALLPNDYDEYIAALNKGAEYKGLRANTLKVAPEELKSLLSDYSLERCPYAAEGFIVKGDGYGNNAYHHAGLYYMQEPAAMSAAAAIAPYLGNRALDMCAAPGGKTTQLAAAMGGKGILVANEVIFNRAKILRANAERMGIRNCMVTSNTSAGIAESLPAYFDSVLVDAPCSGEGMFRKEQDAIDCWSKENVKSCAERQLDILFNADKALKMGGYLVYSTCTFNKTENEEVIRRFINERDYSLVNIDIGGVSRGFDMPEAIRIFPHRSVGEGHFVCLMRKESGAGEAYYKEYSPFKSAREYERQFNDLWESISDIPLYGELAIYNDGLYILSYGAPLVKGLNIVNCGVKAAVITKGRLIPHHNLITAFRKGEIKNSAELIGADIERYLRGEELKGELPQNGWGAATVSGYPLGLVKGANGALKNHYPKGLRKNN